MAGELGFLTLISTTFQTFRQYDGDYEGLFAMKRRLGPYITSPVGLNPAILEGILFLNRSN